LLLEFSDMPSNLPVQCHLWQNKNLTLEDVGGDNFLVLKIYLDESHLIRKSLKCKDCGQLYFYEFSEKVDWEGGNDTQYRTFIPVASDDEAEYMSTLSSTEFIFYYPQLQIDWPSDVNIPQVKWLV
jgi:hypothetical protein